MNHSPYGQSDFVGVELPNSSPTRQMSESCTVISPVKDLGRVIKTLHELEAEIDQIDGSDQDWRSVSVKSGPAKLIFNSMVRQFPGDQFSKLILGMHAFARRLESADPAIAQKTLNAIDQAQLLLGVVAEPDMSETERNQDFLFGITKSIGGIIFNGNAILDAEGHTILGSKSGI